MKRIILNQLQSLLNTHNSLMAERLPKTIEELPPINCFTGRIACQKCNYMGCTGGFGHYSFKVWLLKQKCVKAKQNAIKRLTALDYSQIEDVEVDGIDTRDYPDFCDAFISSATYKGREMTEKELEKLNEDSDYVYQCVIDYLY